MRKFSLIVLLMYTSFCFSQSKDEREQRISATEFPQSALTYFNEVAAQTKSLKLYKETDADKHSYEAKFKLKKLHYSIEFDTLGKLEDIEIVIKEKHIPKLTLEAIMDYLKTKYSKVIFIKIQKKYVNTMAKSDQEYINYVLENPTGKNTHFEIIAEIKTKDDRIRLLKEFTFNNNGEYEKSRPLSSSSYEHTLY